MIVLLSRKQELTNEF